MLSLVEGSLGEAGGPIRAQVGLGGAGAVRAGVVLRLGEDGGGEGHLRVGLHEQLADELLRGRLSAFSDMGLADVALGIGQVVSGPVVVVEVGPGGQVGVDGHGVGDAEALDAPTHVVHLLLEGVLRGVDADHLQAGGGVGLVELLDAGDRALAVDARVGEEVDQGDLAGATLLGQGLVAGRVDPGHCAVNGGKGAAVTESGGSGAAGAGGGVTVEEVVSAGLKGGGVVGQATLERGRGVQDQGHGQPEHDDAGGDADGALAGAEGLNPLRDTASGQGEGQQRDRCANGEGHGQSDGVGANPPGGSRDSDGRQDRARAGHVRSPQDQAQKEAVGGVLRTAEALEAREGALEDLHDLRDHHAQADQGEHDDADPADEVLRQVEQAQHGRSEEREDRETDHKAGYHEVGVEAGGEAAVGPLVIAAITACALCSCGEEDDGEHGKNARGDTRDEPSQQPDGHQTRDGCHDTSPFRSVSCC